MKSLSKKSIRNIILIISAIAVLCTAAVVIFVIGGRNMAEKTAKNIFPEAEHTEIQSSVSHKLKGNVCFGNYPEDFYPDTMKEKLETVLDVQLKEEKDSDILYVYDENAFEIKGSYSLKTDKKGAVITYSDGEGAYYGTITLCNMLKENGKIVPEITVTDSPDSEVRGYSLDMARDRVLTLDSLKQLVLDLADMKMNLLMVFLEMPSSVALTEEEMIIPDSTLTLSSLGTGLTTDELREFDSFARKHYVEAVPFIETIAHLWALLQNAQYARIREVQGYSDTIAMQNPEAQKLMTRWIEIISSCFSSNYFMIGGDESGEIGKGQSVNGNYLSHIDGKPIETRSQAYLDSICIVYNIVKSYKPQAKVLVWHDMLQGACNLTGVIAASKVMTDIIPCIWTYEGTDGEFSGETEYFNFISNWDYWLCPSTNSFTSVTGRLSRCERNVNNCISNYLANEKAKGLLITNWGDGGQKERLVSEYTGLAYAAGMFWKMDGSQEHVYDYVAKNIFGDEEGTLTKQWIELQRQNDLFTHSWGCGWLARVGYENYKSDAMVCAFLYYQTSRGKYSFDETLESLQKIITMAENVKSTLAVTTLNTDNADIIRAEMNLVCNMTIYYAESDIMKIRLFRPAYDHAADSLGDLFFNDIIGEAGFSEKVHEVYNPANLSENLPAAAASNNMSVEDFINKAIEMEAFSDALFTEYEQVWYMANKKGGFDDSFGTLKGAADIFRDVAALKDTLLGK